MLKTIGLWLLYLLTAFVTLLIYTKLYYYYKPLPVWERAEIIRFAAADPVAEVEQALAAGEFRFVGFNDGFGTQAPGIYCPDKKMYEDIWFNIVGQGDMRSNKEYHSAAHGYAAAYNQALVTHPESPYRGECGLVRQRCDWDESEGGLRGCEQERLPF
jgi:hypothetical protein